MAELDGIDPASAGKAGIQAALDKVSANLAALRGSATAQWGSQLTELNGAVEALKTTIAGITGNNLASTLPTVLSDLQRLDTAWTALQQQINKRYGWTTMTSARPPAALDAPPRPAGHMDRPRVAIQVDTMPWRSSATDASACLCSWRTCRSGPPFGGNEESSHRTAATSPKKGDAHTSAWCDGAIGRPLRPAQVEGRGT